MFKILPGFSDDVLAIDAAGKITRADYDEVLIPQLKQKIMKHSRIKMLFFAGAKFEGYELGAVWEDAMVGLHHWRDFSHIAIVTDIEWLRTAANLFTPFFPGVVRLFDAGAMSSAKDWIETVGKNEPSAKS